MTQSLHDKIAKILRLAQNEGATEAERWFHDLECATASDKDRGRREIPVVPDGHPSPDMTAGILGPGVMSAQPESRPSSAAYVLVRFERDGTGYRLVAPIAFPPHFDGSCWVKALIGITDREVWVDISKAYLIEEHHAAA